MEETAIERIEWQAPEYTYKERSPDWFWAIGLTALVVCIVALWFRNYVFAIFIVVSGVSLIMFTLRHPQIVTFSIDKDGLSVGKDIHPWSKIKGFHIKQDPTSPKLLVLTNKQFLPVYTIPLEEGLVSKVKDALHKLIPEIEIEESKSMIFMEKMGF